MFNDIEREALKEVEIERLRYELAEALDKVDSYGRLLRRLSSSDVTDDNGKWYCPECGERLGLF